MDDTELIAKITADLLEDAVRVAFAGASKAILDLRLQLASGFASYLSESRRSLSLIKNVLYKKESVEINDIYVPLRLGWGDEVIQEIDLKKTGDKAIRMIVKGTAGAGKSMFAKKFTIDLIDSKRIKKIPIFFEFRRLNDTPNASIMTSIITVVNRQIPRFNVETFVKLAQNGSIALILDGYDELNISERKRIASELDELASRFPKMSIVITSRPDDSIEYWREFIVLDVLPLSADKAVEMINLIDYNVEIKGRFLKALPSYWLTHRKFLEVPLLLVMMLITFSEYESIPQNMYIFYECAFDALFRRHDLSKEGFERPTRAGLSLYAFKDIFARFCSASYAREKIEFLESELHQFLHGAINASAASATREDDFLYDIMTAVCLMHRDGIYYTFVHRSFQEYFAAYYIMHLEESQMARAIDFICPRGVSDNVITLIHDMSKFKFEKSWAKSLLDRVLDGIDDSSSLDQSEKFLRRIYDQVDIAEAGVVLHSAGKSNDGHKCDVILKVYRKSNVEVPKELPDYLAFLSEIRAIAIADKNIQNYYIKGTRQSANYIGTLLSLDGVNKVINYDLSFSFKANLADVPDKILKLSQLGTYCSQYIDILSEIRRDVDVNIKREEGYFGDIFGNM